MIVIIPIIDNLQQTVWWLYIKVYPLDQAAIVYNCYFNQFHISLLYNAKQSLENSNVLRLPKFLQIL